MSNLSTVVYLRFPQSLPVCSLPTSDVLVEVDFLTFVWVPDSLCCAPRLVSYQLPCGPVGVSPTAASDASPFVPPEHLEWVDSLVGWTSEICACVLKFGPLAKSDESEGAHPNPVAVISLVPPHSIELL